MTKETYYYGTGRRKSAIARVYMQKGTGKITINSKSMENYLDIDTARMIINQPFVALDCENKFDLKIKVHGGGKSGQAGAIRLGIARALMSQDESTGSASEESSYRSILRKEGLVTRDSRKVERKKVGKHKARKSPQFSKR